MGIEVEIVPYADEYVEAHQALATKMWPSKRRRREEQYVRWKFRGPKTGPVDGLLLAVKDGTVLGQLGLIPVDLRVCGKAYPAQWACDLMVDNTARRGGIGSQLLRVAMSRDMVTLGSDPSAAADATMERIGFRAIDGPRAMVLPLRLDDVLNWKMPERMRWLTPFLARLGAPVVAVRSRHLRHGDARAQVTRCPWTEIVAPIAAHQASINRPHISHDESFLRWRCPGLEGFSAELTSFRIGAGGYAVIGVAGKSVQVHDWHATDRTEMLGLFQQIYSVARDNGAHTVMSFAQDDREVAWLESVGFLSMRRPFKVIYYPEQPLRAADGGFVYCGYDSDGSL